MLQFDDQTLERHLTLHQKWLDTDHRDGKQFAHEEASFVGHSLAGKNLINAKLRRCTMDACNAAGLFAAGADLAGIHAFGADFTGAHLDQANLESCHFQTAKLAGVHLQESKCGSGKFQEAQLCRCNAQKAKFTSTHLEGANFAGANLRGAHFQHAQAAKAIFRGADIRDADLHGMNVDEADLRNCRGLWGPRRAHTSGVLNADRAVYSTRGDVVTWELIRIIGALRLFGVSYVAFVAMVAWAFSVRWWNSAIHRFRVPPTEGEVPAWMTWLATRAPVVHIPESMGLQLAALFLLALGAGIFAAWCPDPIKEASRTRWVRELQQPEIEYLSASYSRPGGRYAAAVFFGLGGLYTALNLLVRGIEALVFIFTGISA
jgi:uncharacterized protein YjbI with pentapeptide repeats